MATLVTLTVPVADLVGANFDERRASVWVVPNTEKGIVLADGIRVGGRREQVVNGVATFTGLIATNSADNPTEFAYTATITAPPKGARDRSDIVELKTAEFHLTADANLKDISEAWDDIALPPNWRSDFLDEMDARVAAAEGAVSAVQADRAFVEARVVDDLGTTDGQTKALIETPSSQTATSLKATFAPVVTPEKYGAVGDGVADDTAAVVAAFNAASALRTETAPYVASVYAPGATVALRPGSTYKLATLSGPIEASCNINGAGATLVAPNGYAGAVLLVGHATSGKLLHDADLFLPTVEKSSSANTLTVGSVGVQIQNLHHSRVKFARVQRFETGHWYTGYGQGTVYNEIHPGWVDLCKVAHRFSARTGGWINQNTFKAGGVSQSPNILDGGTLTDRRRTGWRHVVMDKGATAYTVNANTFVGLSYEGDLSEYHFDLSYASHNAWVGGTRFEQGSTARTVTVSGSTLTASGHGLSVGDVVVLLSDTAPGGAITGQRYPYHVVAVPDANTFSISETKGGAAVTFTSAGVNVVFYIAPRLRFDGTDGMCSNNEIQAPHYTYPGPLNYVRVNKPTAIHVAPARPSQGEHQVNRNLVTNGSFRINQRSYVSGATLGATAIGFDRWRSMAAGTALTFTATPGGQVVNVTSGGIEQRIERDDIPAGTYTLSWKGSATARVYNQGAAGPSFASSPITVDLDGAANVVVEFGTGTVGEVQLERGTIVTPFARVPMSVELASCQRHFVRFGSPTGATIREPIGMATVFSATQAWLALQFPVAMRTTTVGGVAGPILTVTDTVGSTIRLVTGGSAFAVSNVVASPVYAQRCRLTLTSTGLTVGQALFADTGDSNALLDFTTGF